MRSSMIQALLSLGLLASTLATPASDSKHQLNTVEDVLSEPKGGPVDAGAKAGATNSEALSATNTIFNDQEVPPMKELNGDDLEKDTKKGYWYGRIRASAVHLLWACWTRLIRTTQVHQALFAVLSPLPGNSSNLADSLRILLRTLLDQIFQAYLQADFCRHLNQSRLRNLRTPKLP